MSVTALRGPKVTFKKQNMKITLVVDGYNAINALPEVKKLLDRSLLAARREILAVSKEYARSSGYITDTKVVFDGQDKYRHLDRIHLRGKGQVFSRTAQGDDKIIETIKNCAKKGRVVLASNDNYVRNNARAYGATPISSNELITFKGRPKKRSKPQEGKFTGVRKGVFADITKEYREHLGL